MALCSCGLFCPHAANSVRKLAARLVTDTELFALQRVFSACSSTPLEPAWNVPTEVLEFDMGKIMSVWLMLSLPLLRLFLCRFSCLIFLAA